MIIKGPVGKFFSEDSLKELMKLSDAKIGDSFSSLPETLKRFKEFCLWPEIKSPKT